jgi:MFS family permease
MPSLHITTPVGVNPAVPQNVRKAKITPLPLSQMIPMTFIIVNESLCSTMLMPFVGPFVAFLQSVSVNEAGNYSGVLIGMFMLGQVISAKTWGRISDKYGRRFPIISGLFTSGLMMLGFGLSTNVWMCAVFRFFQGLFNGNVLVAKTMMADITDKTNQAGGFSFMSLCSAFGFLIGPGLGGLLYDPANSEGLAWAHFDKHGFFATHPAFLPSLVVFVYTNIGMVVCTFLVKESNPKAQPLPPFVRLVYPCMWYRAKPFVLPPIQYEDDEDEDNEICAVAVTKDSSKDTLCFKKVDQQHKTLSGSSASVTSSSTHDDRVFSVPFSPVHHEDAREVDRAELEELAVSLSDDDATSAKMADRCVSSEAAVVRDTTATAGTVESGSTGREAVPVAPATEAVATKFGYWEAFASPYSRFLLIECMMLCATDVAARECLPLWSVATTDVGGLCMTISQMSYILLLNSLPYFVANIFFRIFERRYTKKMRLFRICMLIARTAVLLLPFVTYVHPTALMYIFVFLCTALRQMFVSWCYSLNTMLTARAAPNGHVGSIMGINQACNASVRGLTPFIAAPLLAWSVSKPHIFPFNHFSTFFFSATVFYFGWWRSYGSLTDAAGNLQMAEVGPFFFYILLSFFCFRVLCLIRGIIALRRHHHDATPLCFLLFLKLFLS